MEQQARRLVKPYGTPSRPAEARTVGPVFILYVLQYLGFQEVSMPMHRENPVAFMEFSPPRVYTLIAVCLLVGGMVACLVIENSRFGLALLAILQNELAAEAAGLNARLWKMRSLVVSGMMAAVADGFYARVLLVVTPDSVFGMLVSAQAVVVTLFGGVASVWGPVIGAAILVPLAEALQAELGTYLPGIQGVVYGVAIIAVMLLSADGLFWTIRDRWFRQKAPDPIPDLVPLSPPARPASAHAGTPLLKVEGLSRAFGGLKAVSEVSFSITEGEILGIIGPNGAGKTTLFMKPIRGHVAKDLGLTIVADETYTPPLADATTLVQKIRSGRPDFIVLQSTNVGDDKLLLDKFAERGITASTIPLIGGGGHWTVPELVKVAGKEHLEGMIVGLANWPGKDLGDLEKRFVAKTGEPWFGHDSIFPYAHVMILKEAMERTASTDRRKVGEMLHKIDLKDGPAKLFPDGRVKYDENGRRVGAELCIVQWQKGRPVAVHPDNIAVSKAIWPKLS